MIATQTYAIMDSYRH